jgi:hypothetical protein
MVKEEGATEHPKKRQTLGVLGLNGRTYDELTLLDQFRRVSSG